MSFDRGDSTAIAGKTSVLAIEAGGTNASTVAEARTNLGLGTAATTDSTAYAPAAQGVTNGDSHDHSGGDGAQIAYSSLSGTPSLGTISSQNANNVSITGGSITGITDLAVADGGTGASTAQNARINLLPSYTGNANKILAVNVGETDVSWVSSGAGTGDVVGPASATDNAIVRFDGTTGKLVQNSSAVIDDSGNVGVGLTPSAWSTSSSVRAIETGPSVGLYSNSSSNAYLANNWYLNSSSQTIYKNSATAQYIGFESGNILFANAASGTAGNTASFSERMRIDSSGNVGIGVTPSAWDTFKVIDISNVGSFTAYPSFGVSVFRNAYYDGSVYKYKITSAASYYDQDSTGAHIWYNAASGTAGNAISWSERMRIDSSGNVGIGTSSPGGRLTSESDGSAVNCLRLNDSRAYNASPAVAATFATKYNSSGTFANIAYIVAGKTNTTDGNQEGYLALGTNGNSGTTERMRIDSSGNVGIGTTSASRILHAQNTTATTNAVTQVLRVDSQSSGTPANGIGVGIEFATETSAGNTEVGATIEAITTDVTATSEDFDLSFKTMAAGAAAAERMRVTSTGNLQFDSGYGSVATAYGCRAWVNFNGTGTVAIRASGNVTSITDNNIGDYTINFTTSLTDSNYSVVSSVRSLDNIIDFGGANRLLPMFVSYATGSVRCLVVETSSTSLRDAVFNNVAVFR